LHSRALCRRAKREAPLNYRSGAIAGLALPQRLKLVRSGEIEGWSRVARPTSLRPRSGARASVTSGSNARVRKGLRMRAARDKRRESASSSGSRVEEAIRPSFRPSRSRILSLTADRPVNAARSVSLAFSHPTEIWISRFVYRASSANQTAFDCVAGLLRRIGALVVAPRTTCPGGNCCLRSRTAQASRAHFLCVYRFRASRVTIGTGVGLR
jgi:hypothetical protein